MKNSDILLVEQIDIAIDEAKERGLPEQINFYESLRHAIELKDLAPVKDYLHSDITYTDVDKDVYDFLVDLEKVVIEAATLNFDVKLKEDLNKSYSNNALLEVVACSINLMLEEIKCRTVPKYYLEEIFDLIETPAIITDKNGTIQTISNRWETKFKNGIVGQEIHTILPDATTAMLKSHYSSNPFLLNDAVILSKNGNRIRGFNVKVKHLRSEDKNYALEGYLFVCVPINQ